MHRPLRCALLRLPLLVSAAMLSGAVAATACGGSSKSSSMTGGGGVGAGGGGPDGGGPGGGGGGPDGGGVGGGGPDGGSPCAPANVFVEPWFSTQGGGVNRDTAAGDLTGEGLTDLVTLTIGGNPGAFSVSINKGNGVFAPAVDYPGPAMSGEGIALGDIDGDGYLDVIYATEDAATSNKAIGVALNKKDGTFGAPMLFDTPGLEAEVIGVADLRHNGKMDVVFVATDGATAQTTLAVMLNTGGALEAPVPVNAKVFINLDNVGHTFDFGDVDGDGNLDVVTLDDPNGPCVELGNGDGSFQAPVCYAGPPDTQQIVAVAVADVNGDQKPDVVTFNFGTQATMAAVFLNTGDGKGTLEAYKPVNISDSAMYDGRIVDIDNDGTPDLALYDALEGVVYVAYGTGSGAFTKRLDRFALGQGSDNGGPIMVGDYLGNGLPGLATANIFTAGFEVMPATCRTTIPPPAPILPPGAPSSTCAPASVTFGATVMTQAMSYGSLRAADLDGDLKADLVAPGGSSPTTAFTYQLSNGDGTFQAPVGVAGTLYGTVLAVGDVDGDGKVDIVYGSSSASATFGLEVALNAGGGTFQAPKFTPVWLDPMSTASEPSVLELADVNNDGHLDAILNGHLVLGHGDGTFGGLGTEYDTLLEVGEVARPYRFADVSGDGQLDAISLQGPEVNQAGFCVSLNVGRGNFGPPTCTVANPQVPPAAIATGDLRGNGTQDVVLLFGAAASQTNDLWVYLGNGDGSFAAPQQIALPQGTDPNQIELADFDDDGHLDALVWFDSPSQFLVLPGDGHGSFASTGQTFAAGPGSGYTMLTLAVGDFAGNGLLGFGIQNPTRPGFDVITTTCAP